MRWRKVGAAIPLTVTHQPRAPDSFPPVFFEASEMNRRDWLCASFAGAASLLVFRELGATAGTPITVYKSPTCGCCALWVKHLSANGFAPVVHDVDDVTPM